MPNIKSAKKRMKTAEKSYTRNRAVKTEISSTRRSIIEAAEKGDKETGEAAFKKYCSVVDKAVKKGTITRNAAGRRKARAAKRLAAIA